MRGPSAGWRPTGWTEADDSGTKVPLPRKDQLLGNLFDWQGARKPVQGMGKNLEAGVQAGGCLHCWFVAQLHDYMRGPFHSFFQFFYGSHWNGRCVNFWSTCRWCSQVTLGGKEKGLMYHSPRGESGFRAEGQLL